MTDEQNAAPQVPKAARPGADNSQSVFPPAGAAPESGSVTPMTDAAEVHTVIGTDGLPHRCEGRFVPSSVARQLERKLAAAREEADRFFQLSGRYLERANEAEASNVAVRASELAAHERALRAEAGLLDEDSEVAEEGAEMTDEQNAPKGPSGSGTPRTVSIQEVPLLCKALRNGKQCDEHGEEVLVSRQACEEGADHVEWLERALAKAEAEKATFYMDYRLRCDAESKAAIVRAEKAEAELAEARAIAARETKAAIHYSQAATPVPAPEDAIPPELQMALGNHSIGVFKDGKMIAADREVYAPPATEEVVKESLTAQTEDAAIAALVRRKLRSGNAIPVEACTIRASEVAAIDAAMGTVDSGAKRG